jgi:hypothetical protein
LFSEGGEHVKRFYSATASIILLLAAAPVLAQSAQAIKRIVKKDAETMISVHSNAFKPSPGTFSCVQGGPVTIEITDPPKNGAVTLRPATEKNPNCTNELTGTGIFYRPRPGFTGTDTFSYNRTDQGVREIQKATGPQGLRTVTIEVRP